MNNSKITRVIFLILIIVGSIMLLSTLISYSESSDEHSKEAQEQQDREDELAQEQLDKEQEEIANDEKNRQTMVTIDKIIPNEQGDYIILVNIKETGKNDNIALNEEQFKDWAPREGYDINIPTKWLE